MITPSELDKQIQHSILNARTIMEIAEIEEYAKTYGFKDTIELFEKRQYEIKNPAINKNDTRQPGTGGRAKFHWVNGEEITRKEACIKYSVSIRTLDSRQRKGMTLEEAVNYTKKFTEVVNGKVMTYQDAENLTGVNYRIIWQWVKRNRSTMAAAIEHYKSR